MNHGYLVICKLRGSILYIKVYIEVLYQNDTPFYLYIYLHFLGLCVGSLEICGIGEFINCVIPWQGNLLFSKSFSVACIHLLSPLSSLW